VAGVSEGGGEVARKLPRDDVVLVVCLAGVRGGGALGWRRDQAAAELVLTGAVGDAAWVRENKIGLVSELQWVAAVLLKH
jgi:hypothetical protein